MQAYPTSINRAGGMAAKKHYRSTTAAVVVTSERTEVASSQNTIPQ
jgi:hypothetical protein